MYSVQLYRHGYGYGVLYKHEDAGTQFETLFHEEPTEEELEQLCYDLDDTDYEWLYHIESVTHVDV